MKILRFILSILLVLSCVFTFTIGGEKIKSQAIDNTPKRYKGIITVWQIDGFEGGIGSRKQFLLKTARSFEKQNDGVLIMVINQTFEGAKENLLKGNCPDLISFSNGLDYSSFYALKTDKKFKGGYIGEKCYLTTWCRGNYCLFSNPTISNENMPKEIEKLVVSKSEFTQPLLAILMENIKVKEVIVKKPLDAYIDFVSGKSNYFLGTQRDIYRLNNRGVSYKVTPLKNYNDLYQYIGVTSADDGKREIAFNFIEYLLSEKVQKNLHEIGLMSNYLKVEFNDENLNSLQNLNGFNTVSAFLGSQKLLLLEKEILAEITNQTYDVNKIKNMLI